MSDDAAMYDDPLDEIDIALARTLIATYLRGARCSREMWRGFKRAIPEEWADAMAESVPTLPVTIWPLVIPSPHDKGPLHKRSQVSTSPAVNTEKRLAISRGAAPDDAFMKKARKAGYTMTSLAKKIGIPVSLLSMYRKGLRPCPQERADRIEELTQWPADGKHWPGGLLGAE